MLKGEFNVDVAADLRTDAAERGSKCDKQKMEDTQRLLQDICFAGLSCGVPCHVIQFYAELIGTRLCSPVLVSCSASSIFLSFPPVSTATGLNMHPETGTMLDKAFVEPDCGLTRMKLITQFYSLLCAKPV